MEAPSTCAVSLTAAAGASSVTSTCWTSASSLRTTSRRLGGRTNGLNDAAEPRRAPVDLVSVAIGQRAAQARHADDVSVLGGEAQHPRPVTTHHQRHPVPHGTWIGEHCVDQREVVPSVRHVLATQQRPGGFDQLDHPLDPCTRRRIRASRRGPLRGSVSRSDSEHGPSVRHQIQGRNLIGEHDRIPHAGVEYAGPDVDPFRHGRGRGERDERRRGPDPGWSPTYRPSNPLRSTSTAKANHDTRSLGLA